MIASLSQTLYCSTPSQYLRAELSDSSVSGLTALRQESYKVRACPGGRGPRPPQNGSIFSARLNPKPPCSRQATQRGPLAPPLLRPSSSCNLTPLSSSAAHEVTEKLSSESLGFLRGLLQFLEPAQSRYPHRGFSQAPSLANSALSSQSTSTKCVHPLKFGKTEPGNGRHDQCGFGVQCSCLERSVCPTEHLAARLGRRIGREPCVRGSSTYRGCDECFPPPTCPSLTLKVSRCEGWNSGAEALAGSLQSTLRKVFRVCWPTRSCHQLCSGSLNSALTGRRGHHR